MENLMSFSKGTFDGHGGKASEHHAEMEEIARKVFAEENQKLLEEIKVMI